MPTPRRPQLATLLAAAILTCAPLTTVHAAGPAPILAAHDDNTPGPGQVSASGTARVYRKPEYLDVVVGVETQADTATAAYTECAQSMEAILKAAKALNLSGAEYQTNTVDLSPRYNDRETYQEGKPRKIIGYTAINTVRIRSTDLKAAPGIIDAALKNGANRVDGVSFNVKEVLDAREEALRLATKAAKRKATVMAEALETRLDRVISLNESTRQVMPFYNNRSANFAQMQAPNEDGGPVGAEAIEPGMIEIVVDVTLTYTLK